MKKFLAFVLAAVMVLSLVACGGDKGGAQGANGDEMTLAEIAAVLTEGANEDEVSSLAEVMTLEDLVAMQPETEGVTKEQMLADNFTYYLGIPAIEGAEVVVQDNMMGGPHSMVLVRLPEGSDVTAVRDEIEANANPNKWICMSAEKVGVVAHSNTILMIMSTEGMVDTVVKNFDALWA